MKCRNCGRDITKQDNLWHDDGLVFPQYCASKNGVPGELHQPSFSLLEYAKGYQNSELCEKWNNNIPLHVLNVYNDTLQYCENSQDIQALCEYFSFLPADDLTAYVCLVGDGDYSEVYVTEWSRPYDLQAIYHPISYYVEE